MGAGNGVETGPSPGSNTDAEEERVAVYTVDRAGRVTSWSREAEGMKGYAASQAIGLPTAIFYEPQDRANAVPERELISAIDGQSAFAGQRVRRDGSRFHAEVRIMPLYDDGGRVAGFAKITQERAPRRTVPCADGGTSSTVQDALRLVELHIQGLQQLIRSPIAETPESIVAKLTVIEWRLARLEQTLREALASR